MYKQAVIYLVFVLALSVMACNSSSQSVEIIQKQSPVLTFKEGNTVLTLEVNAGKTSTDVREINLALTGTSDLNDLENVRIYYHGEKQQNSIQFGETMSPSNSMSFPGYGISFFRHRNFQCCGKT
jgi:hypothetical protein